MELLTLLASEKYVSGEKIARALRISRAAVHKRITKLRALGYQIAAEKKRGYSLISRPDLLTPGEIQEHLAALSVPPMKILYYAHTPSTQTIARAYADKGGDEGTIVIAEQQSHSYGRMSREWLSPPGGIWFSLVLRPPVLPDKTPHITLIMALALCKAIERLFPLRPQIKWPNDILINGKKAAGILTEMSAEVGKLNWVVIGVGINVNNPLVAPLSETAVSLSAAAGGTINRARFFAEIISEFNVLYNTFCCRGFELFEQEYNERSSLKGKSVRVNSGGGLYEGQVEKIDSDGYLWLRSTDGELHKIIAGDIMLG